MSIIGTLPDNRLAGLSADLFHKLKAGTLSLDELALFLQRQNPFEFTRNEHGHILLTFDGIDLTGEVEIKRLTEAGFRVSDWAKSCLLSKKEDGYDKNHRLILGQQYEIALMPTMEIESETDRTTENLRKRGTEKYGYIKPLAGVAPSIRKSTTNEMMKKMGFWHIAVPHDPIKDPDGTPLVLTADRNDDGRWLYVSWDGPDVQWSDDSAFAFLVPAS